MKTTGHWAMSEFDTGSPAGGSKWGTVFKITGIGCAVLFLVGAALAGFGVFKAATCCSQLADLASTGQEAEETAYDFAQALHQAQYMMAYEHLSPALQEEQSAEVFSEGVQRYAEALARSMPFPLITSLDEEIDFERMVEFSRWHLRTRFAGAEDEEALELRMVVEIHRSEEAVRKEITSYEFTRIERSLREEPAARTAQNFYEQVRSERYSEALRYVHPAGELAQRGEDGARAALEELRQLTRSSQVRVAALRPESREVVQVVLAFTGEEQDVVRRVAFFVSREDRVLEFHDLGLSRVEPGEDEDATSEPGAEEEAAGEEEQKPEQIGEESPGE